MTSKEQGMETRKQILNAVIKYIETHGYSPTVREICEMTGIKSTSTVQSHLRTMMREGTLETDAEGAPRALRVPNYKFVKVADN